MYIVFIRDLRKNLLNLSIYRYFWFVVILKIYVYFVYNELDIGISIFKIFISYICMNMYFEFWDLYIIS